MSSINREEFDLTSLEATAPLYDGKSKRVWDLGDGRCLVRMVPSLSSFTHQREAMLPGTDRLRLDFYEKAARKLADEGVPTAFEERVDDTAYVAMLCSSPPFETIVKNLACGSTLRKYPGLFAAGTRFRQPVVKFDFRIDPEDQPISDDYVAAWGLDPVRLKEIALGVNSALMSWLAPDDLWDFCIIVGESDTGEYVVISEISPDCMRLKSPTGEALDKDLFRAGADHEEIMAVWQKLVDRIG